MTLEPPVSHDPRTAVRRLVWWRPCARVGSRSRDLQLNLQGGGAAATQSNPAFRSPIHLYSVLSTALYCTCTAATPYGATPYGTPYCNLLFIFRLFIYRTVKNTPHRAARRERRSGVRADHPAATASSARLAAVHARAACLRCVRRWRAHSRQARLLHGAMYHGTMLCGHGSRRRLPTAAVRGWREPRLRLASRWPEGSAGAASAGITSAGAASAGAASAGVESATALARSRAGTYAG